MPRLVVIVALALLAVAGCGEDESEPASTKPAAKDSADLSGIKAYLTDHTDALTAQTAILRENGRPTTTSPGSRTSTTRRCCARTTTRSSSS